MLVKKLGVNALLPMLCRLRFSKSFQSDNHVYCDLNNSTLDFLSLWDGLIALQLFATWYSIAGIPIVHCGQLHAYSNQQPLTRVEHVLHPGQIYLCFDYLRGNCYCSGGYHATRFSIQSVYFRFSSFTKRQLVD